MNSSVLILVLLKSVIKNCTAIWSRVDISLLAVKNKQTEKPECWWTLSILLSHDCVGAIPSHQMSLTTKVMLLVCPGTWKAERNLNMASEIQVPCWQIPLSKLGQNLRPVSLGTLCITHTVNHTLSWLMMTVLVFCWRTDIMVFCWMMNHDRKPSLMPPLITKGCHNITLQVFKTLSFAFSPRLQLKTSRMLWGQWSLVVIGLCS